MCTYGTHVCKSHFRAFLGLTLLIAAPAWAQFEFRTTVYRDSVKLPAPSENRVAILGGLQAGYRVAPWSFSAEYVAGSAVQLPPPFGWCPCPDLERRRGELTVGYSLSEAFEVTAGGRMEDIRLADVSYPDYPLPVFIPVADIELKNYFAGVNYESDRQKRWGVVGSGRLYRGSADVTADGSRASSGRSDGFRTELGARIGSPQAVVIVGAAYESFNLPDSKFDITSEPVIFLQFRYTLR